MTMSILYSDLRRDRKEIRLLQLLPSPGPQYARIPCCRLLRTNLRAALSYNALSYAWGSAETNRVIIVDDIHIRIPQNLYNALITFRPSQLPPFLMWVDYLCINQRNDIEKAWQVGLMREIYSKADHVLAYLGPSDRESQRALEYLDALGGEALLCGFYHNLHVGDTIWQGLAMLYSAHPRDTPFDLILMRLKEILEATFGQHIHASALTAALRLGSLFHKINGWSGKGNGFPVREMGKILERPWFGRAWVLQEIALSKRATFICGNTRIDRARLSAAINAYQCFRQCLPAVLCGRKGADAAGLVTSYHCQAFRALFFRATTMANAHRIPMMDEFPLIALLRLTCVGSPNHQKHGPHHLDSSDPRDKIFALLGLATDRKDLSARGVIPDYTKSCCDVYASTTAAMLQQGHLSVLSLVQPGRGSTPENLPSWVPNWYAPITEPLQVVLDDHMILKPEFCASGRNKSIPAIKVRRDPSGIIYGISMQGFVYDKVHSVGLFPGRASSWDVPLEETFSWPQEWLVEILRLTYRIQGNFASFEERLHAVARASVGGARNDLQGDVVRTGEDIFFEAGHLLRQSLHRIKNRHIEMEARKFLTRKGIENVSHDIKIPSIQLPHDMIGRSLKRLPFVTAKGRLGLGYDNIRTGDVVTIIRGAQVPYILRSQQTGTYNLVSEAYVDGIMDGEALRGATFMRLEIV